MDGEHFIEETDRANTKVLPKWTKLTLKMGKPKNNLKIITYIKSKLHISSWLYTYITISNTKNLEYFLTILTKQLWQKAYQQ